MKNTRKSAKMICAEQIARMAERDNDVSRFFSNTGGMMDPIQPLNVDFASPLDQPYLATSARKKVKRA